MVGAAVDNPNLSPEVVNPPAHVITYSDQQLEAIRGSALAEGPMGRHEYQFAASMQPDGQQPSRDHNPFSLQRASEIVQPSLEHQHQDPQTRYVLPPKIQQFVDNQAETHTDNLARDIYINGVRTAAGIASFDQSKVFELQSLTPDRARQTAVKLMDNVMWSVDRAGGSLPGLDPAKTAELFRLRDEYRDPALRAAMPSEEIKLSLNGPAITVNTYEKACIDYLTRNYAGLDNALARHAFKGFDERSTAQELYYLNHPDKDPQYAGLTPEERQRKIAEITPEQRQLRFTEIISNTPAEHFDGVMRQYAGIPLGEAGKDFYTAIEKKDMDGIRRMLAGRSGSECEHLLAAAEAYAKEKNLPGANSLMMHASNHEHRDEFITLMRGFDPRIQAEAAFQAWDSTTFGVPNIDDAGVQRAFGQYTGPDGKPASYLSAEQIAQLRSNLRAVATERGKDPDKVESQCVEKADGAIRNPSPTGPVPFTANFYRDAQTAGMDPDKIVMATSSTRAYGYDATTGATMLHNALERYNASNPDASDPEVILHTLRFGSDPERTRHLSTDFELPALIQAHEGMYNNRARHTTQPLREALDKKLTGDARVQALQIVDQGFYADRAAAEVGQDLTRLLRLGDGAKSRQEFVDRIDQVEKEYRRQNGGRTLFDAIDASTLPEAQKQELRAIAGIPRAMSIHDELAKAKPDPAALTALLSTPYIEQTYASVYRPVGIASAGNLRVDLEQAAVQGKITREFVVQEELKLSKIPADTIAKLNAELDPGKPVIGTKASVLRGLSDDQLQHVEAAYNFLEVGRAEARGEAPSLLRDSIFNLMQNEKISVDQALRAGMSLEGKDAWDMADSIDRNRASTLSVLSGLRPEEVAQVRDVYYEDRGDLLLRTIINDPGVQKNFANEGEFVQWLDRAGDTLYGPGIKDFVIQIDGGMADLRTAKTEEEKLAALQKLQAGLEWSAGGGAMKNVQEMYNAYFGDKGQNRLKTDLDELAAGGYISQEQQQYFTGLLHQK